MSALTYAELPTKLATALRKANEAQARHDAISAQMHELGNQLRAAAADLMPARRDVNAILASITEAPTPSLVTEGAGDE